MRRIKSWIKAFIVRAIVDDYKANGMTRAALKGEAQGKAEF
jgi:hypothetical protein